MLTAKEIMTKELITVSPEMPLADFARVCAEDHVSGAPVCSVDGSLVGIVSRTDLVERVLDDGPKFGVEGTMDVSGLGDLRQVADIMQTDVVVVEPDTPLPEIATHMAERKIHRIVVMDGDHPQGIITSLDLLAHFRE